MRCRLDTSILHLHPEDVPHAKKQGSIVRNRYFWALRSIADNASLGKSWEFEQSVWVALSRMLLSFAASGYLGDDETRLEFPPDAQIPEVLRANSTWANDDDWENEAIS